MTRKHKQYARALLRDHGVPLDQNFFSLDSTTVEQVSAAADAFKYRKPPNAPGSYARAFYEYANRIRPST